MTDEKTCYNCGNKNCNVYYSIVKKDHIRHFETYEYNDFDCVNHDKWEELKVEEIRTDNTKTLKNALERIEELEKENEELKTDYEVLSCSVGDFGEVQEKLEEEQRKNNGLSDNLTKAKELIKTLIDDLETIDGEQIRELKTVKEAERFLKGVSE